MDALHVHTLGTTVISCHGPIHFPTKKSRDLFVLLLLHVGRMLEREQIAEQLWPMRPPEKSRGSLSTALWRMREAMACGAECSVPQLLSDHNLLGFSADAPYWFDVEVFEQRANAGLEGALPCDDAHLEALEEAERLYQGDFMNGCYDDWCLVERERLQLLFLRVLKRLQSSYRLSSVFDRSIAYGLRLLAIDSLQEDVHRELMRSYLAAGQRAAALEQFHRLQETLARDLQIEPMLETWAVYRQIQQGYPPDHLPTLDQRSHSSLRTSLVQFRRTLDLLESAWVDLCRATEEMVRGNGAKDGILLECEKDSR